MAREIHEREDLLRDAKALSPRVQFEIETSMGKETIFAGFRLNGALSLYFESDPVYHFNSSHQLRRAYVEDRIIKAETGRLIAMTRKQSQVSSELIRHEMSDAEKYCFCQTFDAHLEQLREALQEKKYTVTGQVPEDVDAINRLQSWVEEFIEVTIADSPRVG